MANDLGVTIKLVGADKFESDTKKALGSLDKGSVSTTKSVNAFGKVGSVAFKAVSAAAVAMAAATIGAFVSITKNGVKVSAELETVRAGFKTLLGSAEAANEAVNMIKKDALKTPFDLVQLARLNQMLTGVTKDANLSQKVLLDVGEAVVAMGRGTEEMDRIIVNLQQIGATGRASMIDIRQFAFAGIPVFKMLQEETGLTGEALDKFISDGSVSFEMLAQMFDKANDKGGQFFNAYANNAGTFAQLTANLKEGWNNFTSQFVQDTGIFDFAKGAVGGLGEVLTSIGQNLPGIIEQFKNSKFFEFIKSQFELGKVFVENFKASFMSVWGAMKPAIDDFMKTLSTTFGLGAEKSDSMKVAFQALGKAVGIIFSAIVISIISVSSAILKVNNAILWISTQFSNMKNKITSVFSSIGAYIKNAFKTPLNVAVDYVNKLIAGYNRIPLLGDLPFIPKFAQGGVVGGNNYYGDKVMARVNSGEMVLTRGQQGALFGLLKNMERGQNINFNAPISFAGNSSPMQQQNTFVNMLQMLQ